MKIDLELAAQQTEGAEQSLAYLKMNCRSGIMYNEKDAQWHIRRARLCLDKVERILSEPMESEDIQPQLQQTDVSRSATDYGGYEESLKADLQNAIELQEQQQREDFNAGREAGLSYAIEMLHKHFG